MRCPVRGRWILIGAGVIVEQCWLTLLAARSTRSLASLPDAYMLSRSSPSFPFSVLKYWMLPSGAPSGAVSRLLGVIALAMVGVIWLMSLFMALLCDCCWTFSSLR